MYAVCKTDIGQVRSSNQDICRCGTFSDGSAWTVVCDGMGGVNGGNIASSVACDAICKAITENYTPDMEEDAVRDIMLHAINDANAAVLHRARDRRLTVGDAAVVDGYGVGNQDSETHAFELAGEELEQKSVHEHATRERDGADALVRADIAGDARRGARDGDMEVECEPVGGRSGFNSSQKCLKECFLVQNIGAVQPRWARCEIAGVVVEIGRAHV